ncbi:group-specific protein [Metabacillus litoralis]|uniref:group-specific protein n=1 Tax=Metabacillus litoralis TaxID=152268 RepID=UPI001CFCF086|nr:group-specific protein [Metabacillus litoralis]
MEDNQEEVNSGFEIEVNAPYSLNYLIYVQNIFLNSRNQDRETPLFPYVDSSKWGLLNGEFEQTYREVWEETLNNNYLSGMYVHNGILDFDKALFQKLFENNEIGVFGYLESVKSFLAWWDGIYGKIAIEGIFDEDRMNKIYKELSKSINADKRLKIGLIYDRPILTGQSESSWYAILTIQDVFAFRYKKRPELISKLLNCCKVN